MSATQDVNTLGNPTYMTFQFLKRYKMTNLEKKLKKGHTYRQWIFCLLANCTLFTYGMDCGWVSPTTKILQSPQSPTGEPVSDNILTWIASSMSIAAVFGVSIYMYISDVYGRKCGVILIAVPQALSWIIRLSYSTPATLIIGRVLVGLSAGGCFSVIPIYVKEISQDDIRGILGTLIVLLQTSGLLAEYILGTYLSYFTVMYIVLVIPIVVTVLFIKAPESPAFLIKQEKYDEATETVAYLRGLGKDDKIVQNIIENIKSEEELFKSMPNITLANILREKPWRRGLLLISVIFIFQGVNGAFAIITYASTILISTGVKFEISPEVQTFSFPIFMIVGILSLAACVEKCGRKLLLAAAFLITACSMAVIAILMVIQDMGWNIPSWLPVVAIILAVSMYGAGVSPLPFIIMTEMFSFQIRAKITAIAITIAWTMTSVLVITYTPLSSYIGPYAPFVFYAIINCLASIFTLLYIPETKAKTEAEITLILAKGRKVKNDAT